VSGLFFGVLLVITADQLLAFIDERVIVVVCSSVLAFFVLCTLAPLVKSSHLDSMVSYKPSIQ